MSGHIADRMKQLADAYPNKPFAVGIGWFAPESYDACLALFSDAASMPATFERWLQLAEQTERDTTARGLRVIRVLIQPDHFRKWCDRHGVTHIDTVARTDYASWGAAECLREEMAGGGQTKETT